MAVKSWREHNPSNQPGTCLWCGRKLIYSSSAFDEKGNYIPNRIGGGISTGRYVRGWRRLPNSAKAKPNEYPQWSPQKQSSLYAPAFCALGLSLRFGI